MCCSPIRIKNPSRRYREGIDKMFFTVPCGQCEECRKRIEDDWFVRSFFEFKRIQNCKGMVFFPTLTYNDENLPHWIDEELDYTIPCFSWYDIKSFRDKLRVYLKREGYDARSLRFFIVSEFGGKRGRPHYHALLFCPFQISIEKMLYILRKAWTFGFVGVPKKGLQVQSVGALQYCMKYISKRSRWENEYNVLEYLDLLKKSVKNEYTDVILSEFRKCMPRHYQSTNFGSKLIDILYNDNDMLCSSEIDLSRFGFITKNRFKFKIPRYILNRVLKDTDVFNTKVSSFKYQEIFIDKIMRDFQMNLDNWSFIESYQKFSAYCSPLNLPKCSIDDMWNSLRFVSDKLPELVVYNRVYKDVPIEKSELPFVDKNFLMDNALNFLFNQTFNYDTPLPDAYVASFRLSECKDLNDCNDKKFTFGNLDCFAYFDVALKIIYDINRMLSISNCDSKRILNNKSDSQFFVDSTVYYNSIV